MSVFPCLLLWSCGDVMLLTFLHVCMSMPHVVVKATVKGRLMSGRGEGVGGFLSYIALMSSPQLTILTLNILIHLGLIV